MFTDMCCSLVMLVQIIFILYLVVFKLAWCGMSTKKKAEEIVESMRIGRPKHPGSKPKKKGLYESMLGFEDIEGKQKKHGLILNAEAFSGKTEPYIPKKDDAELNQMLLINNHLLEQFKNNNPYTWSPEHYSVDSGTKESHKQFAEYTLKRAPKQYFSREGFEAVPAIGSHAHGARIILSAARSKKGGV